MSDRGRRLRAPLAVGALTLAATAYVALVDPNEPGHYPLCPTKALTGLDCPACGGLRATHALLHGDLVGALDHNAFVVLVLLPLAVVAWTVWVVRAWRGPSDVDRTPGQPAVAYADPAPGAVLSAADEGGGPPVDAGSRRTYSDALASGIASTGAGSAAAVADDPTVATSGPQVSTTGWSSPRLMWALLALALVFTVVRNIDAVPALHWLGSGLGSA